MFPTYFLKYSIYETTYISNDNHVTKDHNFVPRHTRKIKSARTLP